MGARLTDSDLYRHLWGTEELRAIFDERPRLQAWLDILAALARAQAELGIIPAAAATAIARGALVERLDITFVAAETRRTGHSTLGLIRGLQQTLPEEAGEWVYYGATVQDLTDTWTALAIRRVGAIAWRDLRAIEAACLEHAQRHRDTVMPGRTHGQPGAPITFGLKAASWADEVRRHLNRLREGRPRWLVGQLAGAAGSLAFYGDQGLELRRRFCKTLELDDPGVSWLTARDRIAEFVGFLGMVTGTLGRIGNEVVQLQRPEIGELGEPTAAESVGSITMPHKRNPERSEHLVTLCRLVRAQASTVLEGMVQEHERDGRGWKAEWVAFPEACLLSGTALESALEVLNNLEVDADRMRSNVQRWGYMVSEQVLAAAAPRLGKHRAQALLQEAFRRGRERGAAIEDVVIQEPLLREAIGEDALRKALANPATGSAPAMVDEVVRRARVAREAEPEVWP